MIQFCLFLFDKEHTILNPNGFEIKRNNLIELAPVVIGIIENYRLGTLDSVAVYVNNEFVTRYNLQDYFEGNIPKINKNYDK